MVQDNQVIDETQLIEATLAGDSSAFGKLVSKYQDRLYNTLAHLVGLDDARDLVQDAFVQAFVKLDTFQRTSAFYTWLYRIAFNLAMSRKRRQRPIVSVDGLRERTGNEPVDGSPAPHVRMEQQELACQVRAALATLSDEHRIVLILREMDGCCYETIAEMLDVPVGTVRSRLHRGRMQLREQLKQVLEPNHP